MVRSDKAVEPGTLFLCATPIGNLEDITLRVLRMLGEADVVAAEDTRRTRKLLTRYDIHPHSLISYHVRNEAKVRSLLIDKLGRGKSVALAADAGLPGISDPGHNLVAACIEAGIPVRVLPGPSAVLAAVVVSGLPTHDIRFLGFLPRRSGPRRAALLALKEQPSTCVFYEAPHRIHAMLDDIAAVLGDRQVVLVRELTKKFEEHRRGPAGQLAAELREQPIKGEIVLVVAGAGERELETVSAERLRRDVALEVAAGYTKKEAIALVAERHALPKRQVYQAVIEEPD